MDPSQTTLQQQTLTRLRTHEVHTQLIQLLQLRQNHRLDVRKRTLCLRLDVRDENSQSTNSIARIRAINSSCKHFELACQPSRREMSKQLRIRPTIRVRAFDQNRAQRSRLSRAPKQMRDAAPQRRQS